MLSLCATQWLAGFGGPYGLNYVAVSMVAQALDVEVNRSFMEKLKFFEREVLESLSEKTKKPVPGTDRGCDAEQKKKCKIEFGEHLEWSCENCEQGKH